MPHQTIAIDWSAELDNIALYMQMRLGKTLVAIRWAKDRGDRIIVLAPLSVLEVWRSELLKEGVDPEDIHVREPDNESAPGWWILNYEFYRSRWDDYGDFEVAICDESTKIRKPKTQVTKLVLSRLSRTWFKVVMSGKPNPESYQDFITQMIFLHDGSWMGCSSFWKFRHKYFHKVHYDWFPRKGVLDKMKAAMRERCLFMTRKQAGIGSKKIYQRRYVSMTPIQKKLTRGIEKYFEADEMQTKWTITRLIWLARVAGGWHPNGTDLHSKKIDELRTLVTEELKDESVIIWFRFTREIEAVSEMIDKLKLKYEVITGKTKAGDRIKHIAGFQSRRIQMLLLQEKVSPYGLDLSAADTAIYYSNWYDGEIREQSEDRIIHPTKKRPLLYIDLVSRGTVDEDVIDLLRDKSVTGSIFNSRLMEAIKNRKNVI